MNIDFIKDGATLTVNPEGRLDTVTAPEFESFLNEHIVGIDKLIINCEKLAYVSSAGLRVLLSMQKKLGASMKLTNVCELVMEVFEMTGFAEILSIEA